MNENNLTTKQLGEMVGLSSSQISQIATGKAGAKPMLQMICRYKFWKELGLDREDILKELRLEDPAPAPLFTDGEKPASDREKQLIKMVDSLNRDNRTLMNTLEILQSKMTPKTEE